MKICILLRPYLPELDTLCVTFLSKTNTFRPLHPLDVTTTLCVSVTCKDLEGTLLFRSKLADFCPEFSETGKQPNSHASRFSTAVTNDNTIWQHHVETLLGPAMASSPTSLAEMETEDGEVEIEDSGLRAPKWKIRYAQILRSAYPDAITIENQLRELRKRAISLALRFPDSSAEESAAEGSYTDDAEHEGEKEMKMTDSEKIIWKHLQHTTYMPVRIAFLGDPGVGRTTTILKHLRFYPDDAPFPDMVVRNLRPSVDRFDSQVFTKSEKGYGKFDFHVTIVEPPNDSLAAQVAALRGVDAVMIGFAVNNRDSVRSVVEKWIPFVHKWLGQHVPVSVVGTFCDQVAEGLPVTEVQDILSSGGVTTFDLCIPPFKKCFWNAWVPDGCPMPDGTWK